MEPRANIVGPFFVLCLVVAIGCSDKPGAAGGGGSGTDGPGGTGGNVADGGAGGAGGADPIPDGETVTSVTLHPTGSNDGVAPVIWGQVLRRGELLESKTLLGRTTDGAPVPLHATKLASHADGSWRHARIVALVTDLDAPLDVELVASSEALDDAPLTLADLPSDFDASVSLDLGSNTHEVSARALFDGAVPIRSGPLASTWEVADHSHPHLSVRMTIQAFARDERIRVSAVVENAYAYAATPQNYTYDATVAVIGGESVTHDAVTHPHRTRWRAQVWRGGKPNVFVAHDRSYLLSTGAVPHIDPTLSIADTILDQLASAFRETSPGPLGAGLYETYMPAAGAHDDIGPVALWDATHLAALDARSAEVSFGHGDLAGSWPIHYRDRDTDLPVSLDDYPYMTLLGSAGDTVNPATNQSEAFPSCADGCPSPLTPDAAHQPLMAYIPYLLTGDRYYLDELHFWSNYNLLRSNPYYRDFEAGLVHPNQVRGQAWILRSLGYTAFITPDAHPMKTYFESRLAGNIADYNARLLDDNALGIATTGNALVYDGGTGIAPWQNDFLAWSVGALVALGYDEALPIATWLARSAVGRMRDPGTCWVWAASYSMAVTESSGGPLMASYAEVYAATIDPAWLALPCGGQEMADALGLQPGEMTGYSPSAAGYPSNMQPALAVAVDIGAPGADEAWSLFAARSVQPDYETMPNFAVVPR